MEGRWAAPVVTRGGERAGDRICHSAGSRIRAVGSDPGGRLRRVSGARRLGALLPFRVGVPSKLFGPPAQAVSGDGADRLAAGGKFSPGGSGFAAAGVVVAGAG